MNIYALVTNVFSFHSNLKPRFHNMATHMRKHYIHFIDSCILLCIQTPRYSSTWSLVT